MSAPGRFGVSYAPAAAFDRDKLDPERRRLLNKAVELLYYKPRHPPARQLRGDTWRLESKGILIVDYSISDFHQMIVIIHIDPLHARPHAKEFLV